MFYNTFSIYNDLNSLVNLLLIIFLIIPYVALSLVAVWVYRDAKRKGINAAAWMLIVWIIPFFIGFIIYLSKRDKFLENIS
ncbi:MAG: hypothetical protein ACFFB0_01760 [Promethearchaeota archaeon]